MTAIISKKSKAKEIQELFQGYWNIQMSKPSQEKLVRHGKK